MERVKKYLDWASRHDICTPYSAKANDCKTKKQIFDLLLDVNGMAYFAKSIMMGCGVSPKEFHDTFAKFVNGGYVKEEPYRSLAYCQFDKDVTFEDTLGLFFGCHDTITIPENVFCELHIVQSNCTIVGNGRANIYSYDSTITTSRNLQVKITHVER